MNKEALRSRLEALRKQQAQINQVAEQATREAQTVVGHINEASHWLNTLVQQERAALEEKEKKKKAKKGSSETTADGTDENTVTNDCADSPEQATEQNPVDQAVAA